MIPNYDAHSPQTLVPLAQRYSETSLLSHPTSRWEDEWFSTEPPIAGPSNVSRYSQTQGPYLTSTDTPLEMDHGPSHSGRLSGALPPCSKRRRVDPPPLPPVASTTQPPDSRRWFCETCKDDHGNARSFSRYQELVRHKRYTKPHTLKKSFRCSYPECTKEYLRLDALKRHVKDFHEKKRTADADNESKWCIVNHAPEPA
ncbi:hypothetical protein B0H21DRAFT_753717 [Amylocystis lapponica]|nr:hypothetical protein B0H21DRAFT_753717 [Amylocystis lapponica]